MIVSEKELHDILEENPKIREVNIKGFEQRIDSLWKTPVDDDEYKQHLKEQFGPFLKEIYRSDNSSK